jgi:excisionase family DNA binding protein
VNQLLTPAAAATLLGVKRRQVANYIAAGLLPAENLGGTGHGARYVLRREDVEAFAAAPRAKGGRPRKGS